MVDNPIMYAEPDIASSRIKHGTDIQCLLAAQKVITTNAFIPDLEKMMHAQKAYLGNINNTQKYAVLNYIFQKRKRGCQRLRGFERNNSTTAVFQEYMKTKDLIHVISHEFFHTLTPFNVHSKEIQDSDLNSPKMSAHLWMYEGFTEYFANHFQVHQGLMTEDQFFAKIAEKEKLSRQM